MKNNNKIEVVETKELLDVEYAEVDTSKKKEKIVKKTNKVETDEIKKHKVKIYNVENVAFIANVGNVPKRIYFDLSFKDLEYLREHKESYKNKILTIYYTGNIADMSTVKILPVKSLEDIGSRH